MSDCCSELSRLVPCWINENDESYQHTILKGKNVCNTTKSHDILACSQNNRVYLIDPTIWQFFPNKNSIFIGEYSSINNAIVMITKKYSGNWKKSETLKNISLEEKIKLLKIVKKNINELVKKS